MRGFVQSSWAILLVSLTCFGMRAEGAGQVVVYCAQDQVYAEPIFRAFEKAHGVKVMAVYDSEAVKTVALANRLLAERAHPQCDVFWGNEEMRTRQLADRGVFREKSGWVAFGHRSRQIVINTNLVASGFAPNSLMDFTNAIWRGKVALAYPQFGTTCTHFHALRQFWGEARWTSFCQNLVANKVKLVDGNSAVVKVVGHGQAWIGFTDSDDIMAGRREGLPVAAVDVKAEALCIPNTVGVIRNAPHPEAAQQLSDYLQRPEVVQQLVTADALESAVPLGADCQLQVPWDLLLADLATVNAKLNDLFLR